MFLKYLDLVNTPEMINEIITAKEYKEYKKDSSLGFANFSVSEYKKVLPVLKNIFKDLNKGKFARTVVFDYNSLGSSNPPFHSYDKNLFKILENLDYEVSEESYALGFVKKKGKTVLINDIVTSLRAKNLESMKATYEKSKAEAIKKQIDAIEQFNTTVGASGYTATTPYNLSKTSNYKIVVSMETRKIASQSTKVGWTSCMNLEGGAYRKKVFSGIEQGVIVVWLVKTGDEKSLESPTARVLLKPLKDVANPDNIVWSIDATYGTAPDQFNKKIIKLFEKYNSNEKSFFILNKKIYQDESSSYENNLSDESLRKVQLLRGLFDDEYIKEFKKLSPAEKFYFVKEYDYRAVKYLDFNSTNDIDLYIALCDYFNEILNLGNQAYEFFAKKASAAQLVKLMTINFEVFEQKFKLPSDKIIMIINSKGISNKSKAKLIEELPDFYKKLLVKKNKITGVLTTNSTAEDIYKYFKDNIHKNASTFNKIMESNKEKYRYPKMLANDLVEKIVEKNDSSTAMDFIAYVDDKTITALTKENLFGLYKTVEKNEAVHISKNSIYKLGIKNTVYLIKEGYIQAATVMDQLNDGEYSKNLEKFFIEYVSAINAKDSNYMLYRMLHNFNFDSPILESFSDKFFKIVFNKLKSMDLAKYRYSNKATNELTKILINSDIDIESKKQILNSAKQKLGKYFDNSTKFLLKRKLNLDVYVNRQIAEHYLNIVREK